MTLKISSCIIGLIMIIAISQSCTEPVNAEYDFQDNIIFIDAYALTEPGISSVTINRSIFDGRFYNVEKVNNAIVSSRTILNDVFKRIFFCYFSLKNNSRP